MIRSATLAIFTAIFSTVALHAADYTLIEALPQRISAVRAAAQKGLDTGVTAEMRKASYSYANAMKDMIRDLTEKYYPKSQWTKEALDDYLTALYTIEHFKQNLANVTGDDQGTAAPLDVQDRVCNILEETIATMVETIVGADKKYDFKRWKKKWGQAVK